MNTPPRVGGAWKIDFKRAAVMAVRIVEKEDAYIEMAEKNFQND